MMDMLSRVIVVMDGKGTLELRSFEDVRKFLNPRPESQPIGISKVLNLARSQDQKQLALRAFVDWAQKAGVLVEMQDA